MQKDIAERLGVSPQALSLYKKGKRNIPVQLLIKAKKEFGFATMDDALQFLLNPKQTTAVVAKALEDQEIKDFEKKDIAAEINEAIEALLKLRAYMED